jgi:hypothetical protein
MLFIRKIQLKRILLYSFHDKKELSTYEKIWICNILYHGDLEIAKNMSHESLLWLTKRFRNVTNFLLKDYHKYAHKLQYHFFMKYIYYKKIPLCLEDLEDAITKYHDKMCLDFLIDIGLIPEQCQIEMLLRFHNSTEYHIEKKVRLIKVILSKNIHIGFDILKMLHKYNSPECINIFNRLFNRP